jgi:hypothetical protein
MGVGDAFPDRLVSEVVGAYLGEEPPSQLHYPRAQQQKPGTLAGIAAASDGQMSGCDHLWQYPGRRVIPVLLIEAHGFVELAPRGG